MGKGSMMYLVMVGSDKYLFQLLETCLDFLLEDERYAHGDPEVFRIWQGNKFTRFMNITYRGVESSHYHDDKPAHCDVFTFDLWDNERQSFVKTGWVDADQNGKDMRKAVQEYAIEAEAKVIGVA